METRTMMGREREKKKYTRKPQKTNQTAKGATDADWSPFVVVRTLTMVTTATTTTRNGAHKTTEQREPGIAMKYDDDDDGTRMRRDVVWGTSAKPRPDLRWAARVVGRCSVGEKHFLIFNNLR